MIEYRGAVRNGVVVLDGGPLPEGAEVKVAYIPRPTGDETLPISELLLRFAGTAQGLYPPDYARNHDHYLYGTPKKDDSE